MFSADNVFDAVGDLFVKRDQLNRNLIPILILEGIAQCRESKREFFFLIAGVKSAGTVGITGERTARTIGVADNLNGDLSQGYCIEPQIKRAL